MSLAERGKTERTCYCWQCAFERVFTEWECLGLTPEKLDAYFKSIEKGAVTR
jgi:hypothetical protein